MVSLSPIIFSILLTSSPSSFTVGEATTAIPIVARGDWTNIGVADILISSSATSSLGSEKFTPISFDLRSSTFIYVSVAVRISALSISNDVPPSL